MSSLYIILLEPKSETMWLANTTGWHSGRIQCQQMPLGMCLLSETDRPAVLLDSSSFATRLALSRAFSNLEEVLEWPW